MSTLLIALTLLAVPPEDGLLQEFHADEIFYETIDVRVISSSAVEGGPETTLHYAIDLDTVTEDVESPEKAVLDSRVHRLVVESTVGESLTAKYDTADRGVGGSVDGLTFDADKLSEMWSAFQAVSLKRTATVEGQVVLDDIVGLPIKTREKPIAAAFGRTVSEVISCQLPPGPIESWTEELQWPTQAGDIPILRLYTYAGRNESGLDKIEISAVAVGPDNAARLDDPPLIARGSLYFDRTLKRVTMLDLIIEMKSPQPTRTIVAWRLEKAAEMRDPLGVSGVLQNR